MKTTKQYLTDRNDSNIAIGLLFTLNDYHYLVNMNLDEAVNSGSLKVKETINKEGLINRIMDLYKMLMIENKTYWKTYLNIEEVLEIITPVIRDNEINKILGE